MEPNTNTMENGNMVIKMVTDLKLIQEKGTIKQNIMDSTLVAINVERELK